MARPKKKLVEYVSINIQQTRIIASQLGDKWGDWSKKALDDMSLGCTGPDVDDRVKEVFNYSQGHYEYVQEKKREYYEKKKEEQERNKDSQGKSASAQEASEPNSPGGSREISTAAKSTTTPAAVEKSRTRDGEPLVAISTGRNVFITASEARAIAKEFGDFSEVAEELSDYIKNHPNRYKDHYATLRNWCRRRKKEADKTARPFEERWTATIAEAKKMNREMTELELGLEEEQDEY